MKLQALTIKNVVDINKYVVSLKNEEFGILHPDLLDQSVNSIYSSFGGVDFYPTLLDKAAQLCYSLSMNHCFQDGNKRTGLMAMLTFLKLNNVNVLNLNHNSLVKLLYGVAEGQKSKSDIVRYLKSNLNTM